MKKARILLFITLTVVSVVLCACLMVGCASGEPNGDKNGVQHKHVYEDYVCAICGEYSPDAPITQGLSYVAFENHGVIEYSVYGIGSVTQTEIMIPKTCNGNLVTSIRGAHSPVVAVLRA